MIEIFHIDNAISSTKSTKADNYATASITKAGITTTASSGTIEITVSADNKVSGTYNFTAGNVVVEGGREYWRRDFKLKL